MRDKRPVDELSLAELERILAIRRREERQKQVARMARDGRVIAAADAPDRPSQPTPGVSAASLYPSDSDYDPVAAALHAMTRPDPTPLPAAPPKPTPAMPARITFDDGDAVPHFDEGGDEARQAVHVSPRARRKVMDRLLLLVEVAAVLLITVVGFNLVRAITTLEQETASAQALAEEQRRAVMPTIAPTATLRLEQVVLPTGHIYRAGAEPQFNFNEVPTHLHARVQAEWIQPVMARPPQTSETALSLIVPRLNLDGTIVQGIDVEALKQGVAQMLNGVSPADDVGNVVFAAHNDVYGQLFRHLDQLETGDTMQVRTASQVYTYRVTERRIVAPNETSVLQTRQGATLTLISCYPYQVNSQRIIVFADRVS